jgi:uncharacterized protein YbbC (DUF1343 family)
MNTMTTHPRRPRYGIDALLARPEDWLAGRRVALLANQSSLTGAGAPTLEALRAAPGVELVALLTPEHGWSGYEDDATPVADRRDPRTGLPLVSLYGPRRRPSAEVLRSFDAVVVDLQDVGVRCYTYATTVALLCEAAAETGTRVVVCDRPNPLGPRVDGPPLDPALRSFLGYLDVPFQHGMTIGALLERATRGLGVDLRVASLDATLAPSADEPQPVPTFVPPSPGLPTPEAVRLYPGLVLLEGTNLSEGRGTTLPFQLLGAPWIEGYALAEALNRLDLPGLLFRPLTFRPRSDTHAGEVCHGVQLHVVDARALRPLEAVVRVLAHVRATYDAFAWHDAAAMPWSDHPDGGQPWFEPVRGPLVDALVGDASVRRVVDGELAWDEAVAGWRAAAVRRADGVPGPAPTPTPADDLGR